VIVEEESLESALNHGMGLLHEKPSTHERCSAAEYHEGALNILWQMQCLDAQQGQKQRAAHYG